jgi:hypothetical protein
VPVEVVELRLGQQVEAAAQELLTLVEQARLPDDVAIVVAEVRAS